MMNQKNVFPITERVSELNETSYRIMKCHDKAYASHSNNEVFSGFSANNTNLTYEYLFSATS
jgi:hypothetical protein